VRTETCLPECVHHSVVGTLTSIDSQTIVLRDEAGGVQNLPRLPDTRLELSAGTKMCGGHCALIGGLVGGAAGALVGLGVGKDLEGGKDVCNEGCAGGLALQGAVGGAALGALIGAVLPRERWTPVEIPLRVGIWPDGPGRLGLALSLAP